MSITEEEIIFRVATVDRGMISVEEAKTAMQIFAKQEAIAFANWLSYQKGNISDILFYTDTVEQLWRKFQKETSTSN